MDIEAPSVPARRRPGLYRVAGVVRILVGLFFVPPAVTKFVDLDHQTALFRHWGFPAPGAVAVAVGVLELVAGLALAAGLFMPLPAFALMVDMVGAVATAGRSDGGQYLFTPLALLVVLGFVLSQWGGAWQRGRPLAGPRRR